MLNTIRRPLRGAAYLLLIFSITFVFLRQLHRIWRVSGGSRIKHNTNKLQQQPSVGLIVATQTSDNTTWLDSVNPAWSKYVYVANDPDAPLAVPKNKGREGMTYLTYIIDHYTSLPEILIFHHAKQYQWHIDDPDYDSARALSRLQLPSVLSQGYTNLRCAWTIGCPPDGISPLPFVPTGNTRPLPGDNEARSAPRPGRPALEGGDTPIDYRPVYYNAHQALFPDVPVPEQINAPCCAQFAVTAETVRQRPRRTYESIRRWLLETELSDHISGRIMEYMWHIIFNRPPVDCPDAKQCYCDVYGLCDVKCESQGVCTQQWQRPRPGVNSHGEW